VMFAFPSLEIEVVEEEEEGTRVAGNSPSI